MKLGIDLCSFEAVHGGGKDQVAYYLIQGFTMLGHTDEMVWICREELVPRLRGFSETVTIRTIETTEEGLSHTYWKRDLYRIIQEEGIDVLLFTSKFTPRAKYPVPTVSIEHDVQYLIPALYGSWLKLRPRWLPKDRIKIILDFINRDRIVAISDYDRSVMEKYVPFAGGKIQRIYDPVVFHGPVLPRTGRETSITAINIQHAHKNTLTLVRAFAAIADRIPHRLVCIGIPPKDMDPIRECIEEHGLQDRILFTGFVEDMQEYIRDTALYVNPSTFEGFGMTAVEMMGAGIPVLTADNSAQKEVTMGRGRYYSPAADAEALAGAMLDALKNPPSEDELQESARLVREAYDRIRCAEAYWAFLSDLNGGKAV